MCPGLRCSCTVPSSSSEFRHKFPSAGWYWSVLESPGAACGGLHRPPLRVGRAGTCDLLAHRQSRFANAPSARKIRVTSIGCLVPLPILVSSPLHPIRGRSFRSCPAASMPPSCPVSAPPTSLRALRCQSRSTRGRSATAQPHEVSLALLLAFTSLTWRTLKVASLSSGIIGAKRRQTQPTSPLGDGPCNRMLRPHRRLGRTRHPRGCRTVEPEQDFRAPDHSE